MKGTPVWVKVVVGWLAGLGAGWVFVALGGLALVGECRGFKHGQQVVTQPVVAPPTRMEEKAADKIIPSVDVHAIEPGKKERKRIAEEYHRPDLAETPADKPLRIKCVTKGCAEAEADAIAQWNEGQAAEVIGERTLPLMPDGGKALITLEPDGRIELTTVANPKPFFEWRSAYEFGGLYGVGSGGDARWRAWAAVEPLRLGRFHLRIEAGSEQRAGQVDAYLMAGAVWRGSAAE